MNEHIYLDSAATAKYNNKDDVIIDTIANAMKKYWRNPSSLYANEVKEEIDRCRKNIARFINAESDEIYFTSGASESNSWAIRGWTHCMLETTLQNVYIITTPIEHKSTLESVQYGALGANVSYCSVDNEGFIDLESLKMLLQMCDYEPVLVSISMANNEIGTIQKVRQIADLVHRYDGVLHVDATQALGHIPVDVKELGIDMMSASGHKISPVLKGIGFLYKKNSINIHPLIYGAQEFGLRGGTENTFGIIGLNKAIELCDVSDEKIRKICEKRDYFLNAIEYVFGCKLNGAINREYRLPNNLNVTFRQNITGESLLYTLDLSEIQISTGSACNSHEIFPSHVLMAIGLTEEETMKTVRFTLPDDITYKEIDYVVNEINKTIKIIQM